MANKIRDLIARFKRADATGDELAAALDGARTERADAEAHLSQAERAYRDGLLDLEETKLKAVAEARATAILQRDRAAALVESLETRLAETRASEAAAALAGQIAAVDTKAERIADKIRSRYPTLAAELVALLKEIFAADEEIRAMNARLSAADPSGATLLSDVQTRALPSAGGHRLPYSIVTDTHLAEMGPFAPGWQVAQMRPKL